MLKLWLPSARRTLAGLAAAPTGPSNAALVTLICLVAVALLALVALSFNEVRARGRAPRPTGPKRKAVQGLPEGKIVYQDADGKGQPLLATSYPLSGKPDYVILSPEGVPIPVELKPTIDSDQPQGHHVMQVAAYCVILEDLYDQRPTHGMLRYANHEFRVEYTDALKRKVVRLLADMARCDEQHPPVLTHQLPSKCQVCPFESICPVGLHQEH